MSEPSLLSAARLRHTNESQLPLISLVNVSFIRAAAEEAGGEAENSPQTPPKHQPCDGACTCLCLCHRRPGFIKPSAPLEQQMRRRVQCCRRNPWARCTPGSDPALLHLQRSQLVWKHRWTDVPNRALHWLPALRHSGKC